MAASHSKAAEYDKIGEFPESSDRADSAGAYCGEVIGSSISSSAIYTHCTVQICWSANIEGALHHRPTKEHLLHAGKDAEEVFHSWLNSLPFHVFRD